MKVNKSIFFKNTAGQKFFLFQIINTGDDNLKFIFNQKREGTGTVYMPKGHFQPSSDDVVSLYSECTYHRDGLILIKPDGHKQINPYGDGKKRKSLSQIQEFEPVIKYTVLDYAVCRKSQSSNSELLPKNNNIFNGDSFECVVHLGHLRYANPQNSQVHEIIYRINDVAQNIDMILWIYKSDKRGYVFTLPNSQVKVFSTNNVVEVVEKKTT